MGRLQAKTNKDGSITIACCGQDMLTIDETSDDETLNLFLYPVDSTILETSEESMNFKLWTHEVLANVKE